MRMKALSASVGLVALLVIWGPLDRADAAGQRAQLPPVRQTPELQIPFRLSDVFAQPFPGTDNEALRLDAESVTVTRAIDTVI
jgi:hypothetical protein